MKVTVIGVPSAWGTPHSGVIETPARLRAAGLLDWLAGSDLDVRDYGDIPVPAGWKPPATSEGNASEPCAPSPAVGPAAAPEGGSSEGHRLPHLEELLAVQSAVRAASRRAMERGELPLLIGGECGIAPAVTAAMADLAAAAEGHGDVLRPLIVWLDAHGDLNTPESSPSGLLCGMPLAVALGRGDPRTILLADGLPWPRPEDTWLIGARDLDPGEIIALAALPIHHVGVDDLRTSGAEQLTEEILPGVPILPPEARAAGRQVPRSDAVGTPPRPAVVPAVYLHIDIDCIDPREAPGVTFPVRGGLSTAEVADLAGYLCASGRVVALTLASASLPTDDTGRTLECMRQLLTSIADALSLVS